MVPYNLSELSFRLTNSAKQVTCCQLKAYKIFQWLDDLGSIKNLQDECMSKFADLTKVRYLRNSVLNVTHFRQSSHVRFREYL